jgi:hypothetical protein
MTMMMHVTSMSHERGLIVSSHMSVASHYNHTDKRQGVVCGEGAVQRTAEHCQLCLQAPWQRCMSLD